MDTNSVVGSGMLAHLPAPEVSPETSKHSNFTFDNDL